jgi:hypothetical protein
VLALLEVAVAPVRANQTDESGIHAAGRAPSPDNAAATKAGRMLCTCNLQLLPSTCRSLSNAVTAPAISGAAATVKAAPRHRAPTPVPRRAVPVVGLSPVVVVPGVAPVGAVASDEAVVDAAAVPDPGPNPVLVNAAPARCDAAALDVGAITPASAAELRKLIATTPPTKATMASP